MIEPLDARRIYLHTLKTTSQQSTFLVRGMIEATTRNIAHTLLGFLFVYVTLDGRSSTP